MGSPGALCPHLVSGGQTDWAEFLSQDHDLGPPETRKVPAHRFEVTQIVYVVDRNPHKISVPTLPRGGSNA